MYLVSAPPYRLTYTARDIHYFVTDFSLGLMMCRASDLVLSLQRTLGPLCDCYGSVEATRERITLLMGYHSLNETY